MRQTRGMSQPNLSNSARKLTVPTLPEGVEIATFGTYIDAQKAVDLLSDKAFPVQYVTIVGDDLKMVERVTGRLTYGRVVLAGLAAGAWFGLFVGILLFMFGGGQSSGGVFAAIALGAGFGALFSLISYSFTGGKRDFTSQSQIVAARYTVLCAGDKAGQARQLLAEAGMSGLRPYAAQQPGPYAVPPAAAGAPGAGPGAAGLGAAPAPESTAPRRPDSMYVTPDGRPRYGVRAEDVPPADTTTPDKPADDAQDEEQRP